jgi:hypothetical protein
LTVPELQVGNCLNYIINAVGLNKTGSFFVKTIPSGATLSIESEGSFTDIYTPYLIKNHSIGTYKLKLEKAGYYPVDTTITILPDVPDKLSEITISLRPISLRIYDKNVIKSQLPEEIKKEIKRHSLNQGIWGGAALITAGVGGFFLYDAGKKYDKYLITTDNSATDLHKTIKLDYKIGPSLLGVGGFCALEFLIQSVKKGKAKQKLNVSLNGQAAMLTINF